MLSQSVWAAQGCSAIPRQKHMGEATEHLDLRFEAQYLSRPPWF